MSRECGLISRDVNYELVQESMYRCGQLEISSLDTSVLSMSKVKTLLQPVRSIALIWQLRIPIVVSADNPRNLNACELAFHNMQILQLFRPLRDDARKLRRVAACGLAQERPDYELHPKTWTA